jgi:hypothetical protein
MAPVCRMASSKPDDCHTSHAELADRCPHFPKPSAACGRTGMKLRTAYEFVMVVPSAHLLSATTAAPFAWVASGSAIGDEMLGSSGESVGASGRIVTGALR